MFRTLIAALFVLLVSGGAASAATLTINVRQVGPDVVVTANGNIDLTGLTLTDFGVPGSEGLGIANVDINPSLGLFVGPPGVVVEIFIYDMTSVPFFGPGSDFTVPDFGTGTVLGLYAPFGGIPNPTFSIERDYVSLAPISSSSTYLGVTLATLGFTDGQYSFAFGNNILLVNVSSAVPLPAALPLFGAGLAVFGWARRRRAAKTV